MVIAVPENVGLANLLYDFALRLFFSNVQFLHLSVDANNVISCFEKLVSSRWSNVPSIESIYIAMYFLKKLAATKYTYVIWGHITNNEQPRVLMCPLCYFILSWLLYVCCACEVELTRVFVVADLDSVSFQPTLMLLWQWFRNMQFIVLRNVGVYKWSGAAEITSAIGTGCSALYAGRRMAWEPGRQPRLPADSRTHPSHYPKPWTSHVPIEIRVGRRGKPSNPQARDKQFNFFRDKLFFRVLDHKLKKKCLSLTLWTNNFIHSIRICFDSDWQD